MYSYLSSSVLLLTGVDQVFCLLYSRLKASNDGTQCTQSTRSLVAGVIAPIPIGFAVVVDHLVGVPYTGASMNPARSFGPAFISGQYGSAHWIYWFGPCFGAAFASATYK